jgi:uncharacterized protein YggE
VLSVISSTAYFVALTVQNQQRDAREAKGETDKGSQREIELLGDMSIKYRYIR